MAATEQEKEQAIADGLSWLDLVNSETATEAYWSHGSNGTLAATASAALAYIEEGYLPNDGSTYGDLVGKAVNYIFNRATAQTIGGQLHGHPEDYDNSGSIEPGEGNGLGMWFNPGNYSRSVYTTGIVAPVVYSLGQALGPDTTVGTGSAAVSGMTYREVMRDIIDWYSWGQDDSGSGRGGWRYYPNYGNSDNSTAQWGSLPILYGNAWGLETPEFVIDELELWVNYIQNANGGSGYSAPWEIVNVAKTGGLLLELAVIGAPITDPRVVAALDYLSNASRWNSGPYSTWYGNLGHPYAMWGVYKGLEVYGLMDTYGLGPGEDFLIGEGIAGAPGGFQIGQDWWDGIGGNPPPVYSLTGDWYSHYSDWLVNNQFADGHWNGYTTYFGANLSTAWYINILNAAGAPPPVVNGDPIPEPTTLLLLGSGLLGLTAVSRRRKRR
jgi:hypothetical protein